MTKKLEEVVESGGGFAFYALMVVTWAVLYGAIFMFFLIA